VREAREGRLLCQECLDANVKKAEKDLIDAWNKIVGYSRKSLHFRTFLVSGAGIALKDLNYL
jgi:hypothetical protein